MSARTCANCDASANKKCGGCGKVAYCAVACQKAHWAQHKACCRKEQGAREAASEATALSLMETLCSSRDPSTRLAAELGAAAAVDVTRCLRTPLGMLSGGGALNTFSAHGIVYFMGLRNLCARA